MLREEFENRMGNKVTPEAFEDIHELYISAGDMDKDRFCDDYKLHGGSKILAEIWGRFKITRDVLKIYKRDCSRMVELLTKIAAEDGNTEAENLVVEVAGRRDMIVCKLRNHYELSDADRDYIVSALGKLHID